MTEQQKQTRPAQNGQKRPFNPNQKPKHAHNKKPGGKPGFKKKPQPQPKQRKQLPATGRGGVEMKFDVPETREELHALLDRALAGEFRIDRSRLIRTYWMRKYKGVAACVPLQKGVGAVLMEDTIGADGQPRPDSYLFHTAIRRHTHCPNYLSTMLQKRVRVDLNGKKAEEITKEEKADACRHLERQLAQIEAAGGKVKGNVLKTLEIYKKHNK